MRLVYIAGPFRGPNAWVVAQHVRVAEEYGMLVAECGCMPVIPHANTAHFDGTMTDEFWLAGTIALLRKCDAILMIPGWQNSTGAREEMRVADEIGLPIYKWADPHWERDMKAWA